MYYADLKQHPEWADSYIHTTSEKAGGYSSLVALWAALIWENGVLPENQLSSLRDRYLVDFIIPPKTPRELIAGACPDALPFWSSVASLQLGFSEVVDVLSRQRERPALSGSTALPDILSSGAYL